MAGNGYGDSSPPREEKQEEEGLSTALPLQDADETSDVSASLFKEMTSEEETEEVASGTQNQIRIGKGRNSNNEMGDADTDGDSSGEEGSLFEDIDGEDEGQYAGLRGAHQSGYGGTSNSGGRASHGIYDLEGGIPEEVPFIRTGPRDLDGPYDVGSLPSTLGLMRGKDEDASVGNLESKVERVKDESSFLEGISRDYGSSSGEEGGEDGTLVCLADENVEEGQISTLVVTEDPPNQPQESLCPEKVSTVAFRVDRMSGEDKLLSPSAGQQSDVPDSGPSEASLDGQDRTFTSDSPKGRVRKRGRASRELGALLMDSNAGRRGKRAFELQGARTQASAGESADAFAASDGVGMPPMGPGSIREVRITRSQVSSRSAVKDDNLDSKIPEARGRADVSAKRTGKRSVTRTRQIAAAWAGVNANDSSQQSPEVVTSAEEKSSSLGEAVADVQLVTTGLLPSVRVDEALAKSTPIGKSGGRAKKTRGQGKEGLIDGQRVGMLNCNSEGQPDSREVLPSSPLSSRAQDVDGSEMVINYEKSLSPLPSVECGLQDAVCSLNSQETEVHYVEAVVENILGRRRSNRQAAKTGEKVEVGQPSSCNGKLQKNLKGRKRASSSKGKKSEEVSDMKLVEKLENCEEFKEPFTTEGITIDGGDTGDGVVRHDFSPQRGKGRKPAKGKRNLDTVSLGKGKEGSAVSRRPPIVRSKTKQGGGELVSGLLESPGVKEITLTGDDSAGADQRSDKNASSITGDTKDTCQDPKEKNHAAKVSNVETANGEGSQERAANCVVDPSLQGDDGNTGGVNCRDFRDDARSATSCDSLVKKEAEVGVLNQGFIPDGSLPHSGGCGDLEATETGKSGKDAGATGSGKAKTRQRRVTQQKEGAQLGAKASRKGKKGGRKKESAGSVGLSVRQEKVVSAVSKKKTEGSSRDRRKSVLETNGKISPDANKEVAASMQAEETSKIANAVDAVEFDLPNEGLEQMHGEQVTLKEEANLTSSGIEVEVTKRRKIGMSTVGSALELATDNCKPSEESHLAGGAKSSRHANGGKKKSKKSLVSGPEATASGVMNKNESRRPSRAKGTTIKALSSIKDQTSEKASEDDLGNSVNGSHMAQVERLSLHDTAIGEAGDIGVDIRSLDRTDSAKGLEAVQDSGKVDSVKSPQVLKNEGSPEDTEAVGEDMSSGVTESDANENERRTEAGAGEAGIPRKSWVLCDDCNKWRCIPVELADQIDDTNAKWSCRDNPNPDYADCSIPQEKSNAEINAELQISEVSATEEGDDKDGIESKLTEDGTASGDNKPAVWKLIRRNIFQHRRTKAQGSDEIMVCQCTPPEDGGVGCGDNCLNRVLNIECVQEHCPCGEACSNQQFQKRMYAPVATFRCGKKGFGLKVLKFTPKDSFLIEYVGEVLDVGAFEERQQDYARNGQKHFYFMTLSSTEVIDACSKGNFGRFINHSCEPNCKTEKWMVNGEVCIGLFAIRDIAEGEEVTFDYNYVRVRGASAKKCECGSSQCRGFIGADSETPRAVVESDSEDEEDPEPIMIVNSDEEDNHVDENKVAPLKKPKADAVYRETTSTRPSRIKRKLVVPVKEKGPVAVKRVKTSSTSRKFGVSNPKGLTVDVGRHEGARALSSDVQEKLDDLLDKNGGLKKRKDVAAQYLKLLVLTDADNKKDAATCSVRDISMLLEALLKTSSRSVLSDIMKMNGLRMLHHFIKQLRKQWDKTPILRKLMKVLELLASERVRVLTQQMINSAPPCRGMESFSESLFELTRHRDPEVCQMARRFRNRWIPPRPQVYEQHNKGPEKPPQLPLKAGSPAQMHSSNQMQLDSNHFSSPQKQSPPSTTLKGVEGSKVISGSSAVTGSQGVLASAQSQNDSLLTDEITTSKPSQGEVSTQSGPATETGKAEMVKRKRVSRWDAPAKVEKGTYEPIVNAISADVPVTDSSLSSKQTCLPPASQVQAPSPQFPVQGSSREFSKKQRQFGPNYESGNRGPPCRYEAPVGIASGKQGAEEIVGTSSGQPAMPVQHTWQPNFPGAPPGWPPTSSAGPQDSTRLPFGVTPGLPQLHSGCAPGIPQRRPEPGYGIPTQPQVPHAPGPLSVPPPMQMNGPPMIPTGAVPLHPGPQQVSPANVGPHVGVPLPGPAYPGCPPPHMGLGGPPLQGLHGMNPNMPIGYPQGVHYGQWGPAPGMPHFGGPPAFPMDDSRRYLPQAPWPPNTSLYNGDGSSQRTSINGEILPSNGVVPANGVQTAADLEPEPPVPGLSPPPSTSNTHNSAGLTNSCQGELSEEQRMPPEFLDPRCGESYFPNEVPETRQDREHGPDYYRAGIPDIRDTGSGFQEEHWDDPESQSFREHVFFLVKSRLRRHKLRSRDIDKFCTKLADVIVRKEVAKCLEHRNQGSEKIIVRSKLAEKVESYVDNQVEQFSRKCDRSYKSGDISR